MQEDERKIISIDPKNRINKRDNRSVLCHTRLMISAINQVVTNVAVRYAIPGNIVGIISSSCRRRGQGKVNAEHMINNKLLFTHRLIS